MFGRKNKDDEEKKERAFVKELERSRELKKERELRKTNSLDEKDKKDEQPKEPITTRSRSDTDAHAPRKEEITFNPDASVDKYYLDCVKQVIKKLNREIQKQNEIKQKKESERTEDDKKRLTTDENLLEEAKQIFFNPHKNHKELVKLHFQNIKDAKTIPEFKLALALADTGSDNVEVKMPEVSLVALYQEDGVLECYLARCIQTALQASSLQTEDGLKAAKDNFARMLNTNISLKEFVDSISDFGTQIKNVANAKTEAQFKEALQAIVTTPASKYFQTCKTVALNTPNIDTEQGLKAAKEKFRKMMLQHFKLELGVDRNAFSSTYAPVTAAKNKEDFDRAMDKVMQSRPHSPAVTMARVEKEEEAFDMSKMLDQVNPKSPRLGKQSITNSPEFSGANKDKDKKEGVLSKLNPFSKK